MKNTFFHPQSVSKVNLSQLNKKIYSLGSQLQDKYFSYATMVQQSDPSITWFEAVAQDYSNLILLIQQFYTSADISDPIRSIFGKYYVIDKDSLGNEIIYLINSNDDPTDKNKYPFPFKDIFTIQTEKPVDTTTSLNKLTKEQQAYININNVEFYNFLTKYAFTDLSSGELNTIVPIMNPIFKDALVKLIAFNTHGYTKYVLEKHSEKNIASKNGNYLAYNLVSEYNQYIRQYENYFSSSLRRETLIPNYYVTDLYLKESDKQSLAKNLLTLNNTLNVTRQTILSNEYYIDFVDTLSKMETEQVDSLPVTNGIILDDIFANQNQISLSSENFPYNINLKFSNFSTDGIIEALEKKKLNLLATNNFYAYLQQPQRQKTPFYVQSEEIVKTKTQDEDAYIDLDGDRYYLNIKQKIGSVSIDSADYDNVLSFNGSFEFKQPKNLKLFATEQTIKTYQSNSRPLSLFDYLKINGSINDIIEPKLNIETILNNSSMACSPITFDVSKYFNNLLVQKTLLPRKSDVIDVSFVDTQVIYDKLYKYDVDVVSLVEQIKYTYTTVKYQDILAEGTLNINEEIINTPISVLTELSEDSYFYKNNLFSDIAVVVDDPPTPVDINIVPFIGVPNRLMFMFNTQDTTIFQKPILISQNDRSYFTKVRHKQRPDKKEILFQSVSDISAVQVFRSLTRPKTYFDFSNSLYQVIPFNGETSTTFIENLQQNIKYYYTFRSIDVHGNISNPSDIFEVKIINNDGAIYPIITPYYFEQNEKLNIEKSFKKYLAIDPAIIQQQLTLNEDGSLVLGVDNGFWNQDFKIRITSKESGKSFDINLNFTKKIIETI